MPKKSGRRREAAEPKRRGKGGKGGTPRTGQTGQADNASPVPRGIGETEGGHPEGGQEVTPVASKVESPNDDPGKPPSSAKRLRRTNAERMADLRARDLEATKLQEEVKSEEARQIEAKRHAESVEASPIFAMGYGVSFSLVGKMRARNLPPSAKQAVLEVYNLDTQSKAVQNVAYRTARVCHKWFGLEWLKLIGEEFLLIAAIGALVDEITSAEERVLKTIGVKRGEEKKTEAKPPSVTTTEPTSAVTLPMAQPPASEVGPSGEDDREYAFDDIDKVSDGA